MTDDTRLAPVEPFGEVDIVEGTYHRRIMMRIETRGTHTRSVNVVAAVAASTVTMVLLQLIRGNAIAHVILVPHRVSQKAHAKEAGGEDVS